MIENNKSIGKEVSKTLNIKEEEVFRVLDFLYRHAKTQLENFNDIEIYIYGLGSFVARRKKIHQLIKYYEVRKERLSEVQAQEKDIGALIVDCDVKIGKLRELNELYRLRDEKRKNFKNEQTAGDISE